MNSIIDIHRELTKKFPNQSSDPFNLTSPPTTKYNCIAWAYGVNDRWMWPGKPWEYWPPDIPRVVTIEAFIELFESIGYSECDNGEPEDGFKKVCIFTDKDEKPTHAAKQLPTGEWSSKLGKSYDVQHSIEAMEGGKYGNATVFMKKMEVDS